MAPLAHPVAGTRATTPPGSETNTIHSSTHIHLYKRKSNQLKAIFIEAIFSESYAGSLMDSRKQIMIDSDQRSPRVELVADCT